MKHWTIGITLVIFFAWLFGFLLDPPAWNVREIVHELFYVTGTVAYAWMALCLVIAVRPAWLERLTKTPLDKLYAYHRWLGYGAVILSLLHWVTKSWAPLVTFWMNLAPGSKPSIVPAETLLGTIWQSLRAPAESTGQFFTIAAVVLAVVTAWKVISYGKWLRTHKLFAWIFIGLALHCVRLMDAADFFTPYGWTNLAVTVLGLWAAVKLLCEGPGAQKCVTGVVREVEKMGRTTRVVIESDVAKTLQAGQFLFLRVGKEAPHPFSVASCKNGQVTFWIRELGDFTKTLATQLNPGDTVTLEGPWGGFTPKLGEEPETWVAAGIGIAPFASWLEEASHTRHGPVTLFWCVRNREEEALVPEVETLALQAGIRLVVVESRKTGRLTPTQIEAKAQGNVAVCGSSSLSDALRRTLSNRVVRDEVFHWR